MSNDLIMPSQMKAEIEEAVERNTHDLSLEDKEIVRQMAMRLFFGDVPG